MYIFLYGTWPTKELILLDGCYISFSREILKFCEVLEGESTVATTASGLIRAEFRWSPPDSTTDGSTDDSPCPKARSFRCNLSTCLRADSALRNTEPQ